jgi:hypothetical protein
MVKVKNFPNRGFADLARQALEDEGITAWVSARDMGMLMGTPVGADLYVEEDDGARARELLEELFGDI